MSPVNDASRLDPLPGHRLCAACGGPTRPSHTVHAGAGQSVIVHVCTHCGASYAGGVRSASERDATARRAIDERRARRESRPGRRPLDEGGPDNPVLDAQTADELRRLLGGGD